MLNSGKKNSRIARQKNKYSNSRVVRRKNSERNKKTYPPPPLPCKLNGRFLTIMICSIYMHIMLLCIIIYSER